MNELCEDVIDSDTRQSVVASRTMVELKKDEQTLQIFLNFLIIEYFKAMNSEHVLLFFQNYIMF